MKHQFSKSLSNPSLNQCRFAIRKQTSPLIPSTAFTDLSSPHHAFRQESIKELLRSMKSLQISMLTQSSTDNQSQMQMNNHASSTAKRLNKIIQSSNDYNSHQSDQNYFSDSYQCFSPSKTPKAVPSFLKQKFKDFFNLGSNEKKSVNTKIEFEHLKTEIKQQEERSQRKFPTADLFNAKRLYDNPLNFKLTLNPEIKKQIEECKKSKGKSKSGTIKVKSRKSTKQARKIKKSIDKEIRIISTIQKDADKFGGQFSREIFNENKLPSITSSRSKAQKKTQALLKVSSAYLETTTKIGKEKAKQKMKLAQNEENVKSSNILERAIHSLLNDSNTLKATLDIDHHSLEKESENEKYLTNQKSISHIECSKEGFENVNLDQKFNYNGGIWKKTEKQKFLEKMKKLRSAWNDQSFLKEETAKNHILKSIFPFTPRMVKFTKIYAENTK